MTDKYELAYKAICNRISNRISNTDIDIHVHIYMNSIDIIDKKLNEIGYISHNHFDYSIICSRFIKYANINRSLTINKLDDKKKFIDFIFQKDIFPHIRIHFTCYDKIFSTRSCILLKPTDTIESLAIEADLNV